jgi:hypothetical protein
MARKILTSTTDSNLGNLHYYHLPKGMLKLKIEITGGAVEITSMERIFIPDPNARYFFAYQPSAFTDDNITIKYGANGFLSSVHTIIDDQTDDFISKIGEFATDALTGALGAPKTRGEDEAMPDQVLFSGTIDPLDDIHIERINSSLQKKMKNLVFAVRNLAQKAESTPKLERGGEYGIYSRPLGSYEISLSSSSEVISQVVNLPDPDELHFIRIPNPSFVQTDFQIDFNELGYPTTIIIKKPSSALALLQVPLKIISSILELPTKLIQFRINLDNSKGNLDTAQTTRIDKLLTLREKEELLEESNEKLAKKKEAEMKEEESKQSERSATKERSTEVSDQKVLSEISKLAEKINSLDTLVVLNQRNLKKLQTNQDSKQDE